MSSKEHCHGCGKLWSEESPDCVFNYHKKPETESKCQIKNCRKCGTQITQLWVRHPYDPKCQKRTLVCLNCDLILGVIKKGDYDEE